METEKQARARFWTDAVVLMVIIALAAIVIGCGQYDNALRGLMS